MARQPNLWHSDQICGRAAISVAGWPLVGWPNLCHSGHISVAQRPYLWHSGHICGTAVKSVAYWKISMASRPNLWPQQPNFWQSSLICIQNRKFVYKIVNLCSKEENIRIYFPFLVLRRQSKN